MKITNKFRVIKKTFDNNTVEFYPQIKSGNKFINLTIDGFDKRHSIYQTLEQAVFFIKSYQEQQREKNKKLLKKEIITI